MIQSAFTVRAFNEMDGLVPRLADVFEIRRGSLAKSPPRKATHLQREGRPILGRPSWKDGWNINQFATDTEHVSLDTPTASTMLDQVPESSFW